MSKSYRIANFIVTFREEPGKAAKQVQVRETLEKLCLLFGILHKRGRASHLSQVLSIALEEYAAIADNKENSSFRQIKMRSDFGDEEEYLDHVFSYEDPEGDEEQ